MRQAERDQVEQLLLDELREQRRPLSAFELYAAAEARKRATATRSEMHRALWRLASRKSVTFRTDWKVELAGSTEATARPRSGARGVRRTTP